MSIELAELERTNEVAADSDRVPLDGTTAVDGKVPAPVEMKFDGVDCVTGERLVPLGVVPEIEGLPPGTAVVETLLRTPAVEVWSTLVVWRLRISNKLNTGPKSGGRDVLTVTVERQDIPGHKLGKTPSDRLTPINGVGWGFDVRVVGGLVIVSKGDVDCDCEITATIDAVAVRLSVLK